MFARNLSLHGKKAFAVTMLGSAITYSAISGKKPQFVAPVHLLAPRSMAFCDADPNEVKRVYIGLSLRSMMDTAGMMILLVNTESPAWHGEIKVGDILLEIDGKPINVISDLYAAVGNAHGKTLTFKINRKGMEVITYVNFPPAQL